MDIDTTRSALHNADCLLCGKPLVYAAESRMRVCALCKKSFSSNAACEDGHFVCDACHTGGMDAAFGLLLHSAERDPLKLFEQVVRLKQVHLHGPEHHVLVPAVLLTAYRNNGGKIELETALQEALARGAQVPGGACGAWGMCGAAAGAGIFASIVLGSDPLNAAVWPVPQTLTAACLGRIAHVGGPRCCKRDGRLSIEEAARFSAETLEVPMPLSAIACAYHAQNRECIKERCPYYPTGQRR